jgi:hypothetical protein
VTFLKKSNRQEPPGDRHTNRVCWLRRIEPFATLALSIGEGDWLIHPPSAVAKRERDNAAEMAAREMSGLSLDDALSLRELLANFDPALRASGVALAPTVHR